MKKDKERALLCRFEEQIELLCGKNEPLSVLVALSGGADSCALLHLCALLLEKRGGRVEAYHLNHRIRGEEAEADARFCSELCARLGILLHLEERDLPALARAEKKGLEETARAVRYMRLEEVQANRGLGFVATAHNAEDQLETVLFRIARGTSLKGLCGIPQKRGAIIRPLLPVSGQELRSYCQEQGICYRVDSTNLSDDYARNDLRHHAVPALKRVNSAAALHAVRMSEELMQDDQFLWSLVPRGRLCRRELAALPAPLLRRYLLAAYAEFRQGATLEWGHLEDLCRLIKEGKQGASLSLPLLVKARIFEEGVCFEDDKTEKEEYSLPVLCERIDLPFENTFFIVTDSQRFDEFWVKKIKIHKLFNKESLNSATIKGTLFVRPCRAGDRIRIGGMTKKVSALLGEMRIPQSKRAHYPLLCDEQGALWLPGKAARDESRDPSGDLIVAFGTEGCEE